MLVSRYRFSTMPDPMKLSKIMKNIFVIWKSKMAAKMAAEHVENVPKTAVTSLIMKIE